MNIGMLWFDNDTKTELTVKIHRAVDYYQHKYGQKPNLCFIHPSMLPPNARLETGLELRTTRSVLPNHFWLGVSSTA